MSRTITEFARLTPLFLEYFAQGHREFGRRQETGEVVYSDLAQVLIDEIGSIDRVRAALDTPAYMFKFQQHLAPALQPETEYASLEALAATLAYHYRMELAHAGYFLLLFESGALTEILAQVADAYGRRP